MEAGLRVFKHRQMKRHHEALATFYSIINRHVEMSVACIVNRRDIEAAIARVDIPHVEDMDWSSFRNPYYVTFRFLMDNFHRAQRDSSELLPIREPVDFYFDTSAHKRQIISGWETYLEACDPSLRQWFGGDPKFERDDEFLPLQAADFNAGTTRLWLKEHGLEAVETGRGEFGFVPAGHRQIHHLVLSISEDDMARAFVAIANKLLPDSLRAVDRSPPNPERIDPPSPAERLWAHVKRSVSRFWGRP